MSDSHILGVVLATTSALVWGTGDFSGGLAARRASPFQVLLLVSLVGCIAFSLATALSGERMPDLGSAGWAALAGIAGALGIPALYAGLASRNAAIVAPTAAVVGTALPIVVTGLLEGLPGPAQLAGFAVAGLGIWLAAQSSSLEEALRRRGLILAVVAGLCFGGFFVCIGFVEGHGVFGPLAVAKAAAVLLAAGILWVRREPWPRPNAYAFASLAGLLDAGGNALYLVATRLTRVDIAAVLASMYPGATVILSRGVLKESVAARQWLGVVLCMAATALMLA